MLFKIIHLYLCIRNLGFITGFRYWKLTIKACGNPEMVRRWAADLRKEANHDDVMKKHQSADHLRAFATEIERCNNLYHYGTDR